MASLREIRIQGLFGLYEHTISLRTEPPITIVAGPNGVGKTTLLRLTKALLSTNYNALARADFSELEITSIDGVRLRAVQVGEADDPPGRPQVLLQQFRSGQSRPDEARVGFRGPDPADLALPPYIEPHNDDVFIDTRDGELVPADYVYNRYGRGRSSAPPSQPPPDWFIRDRWRVDFIETKRLDTQLRFRRSPRRADRPTRAPIYQYLEAVADALEEARRESARVNQASTRTVARRLLTEYSRKTVRPDPLRARYAQVGERASRLTANGLLSDSLEVLPDGKLNPTEKRFLELFLDDFETKLRPLAPVSEKLDQLRAIVEPKFLNKSMAIDPNRGVRFLTRPTESEIDPADLSSGEQHELALMSSLLFSQRPGTTVLIDEPELSLHISWQHEMIADLEEVARLAHLSFILATHSTAIINGRWDLVEDLGPIDDQAGHARTGAAASPEAG